MALTKKQVKTLRAPSPPAFLSQGLVVGDMVYVSGSLGMDPITGNLVDGTVKDRTAQALQNMAAILEEAGSSLEKVIKVTIFITDMKDYAAMNEAYLKAFNKGIMPTRTCIAVHQLPKGTDVEIEASAYI
ncbi:Endoribonuclease L-PSP/chorismate mutase-like protein [Mariannaea sp. PMI_226]|nr:Endoribonuclease L-PSP/chorismate mutase-like protein [Mariannaea sp. PMI_226]